MKRSKEDYRGWALCCIAREIDKAWVKKNYMGASYVRRLGLFEDFSNPKKYWSKPHEVVKRVIEETKHAHWPGKAAMIRELKRQLDEYNQLHANPLALGA